MAYVTVPKDLTKVKNKVAFNLTKRQIVCMAIAAAFGIPFFFLTRDYLGITNAATGMVLLMVPAFLFGMYEKAREDPAEHHYGPLPQAACPQI